MVYSGQSFRSPIKNLPAAAVGRPSQCASKSGSPPLCGALEPSGGRGLYASGGAVVAGLALALALWPPALALAAAEIHSLARGRVGPVSHGKEMGSEGSLGAKHMVWGGPYEAVGGCRVPTGGHSVINMGGTAT